MKTIDLIAGARPNFMKIAPIIRALQARQQSADHPPSLSWRLVHTGQHWDRAMNEVFFEELGIPAPDEQLGTGGATHAEQTARVMVAYEALCGRARPDCTLVVGDVNSTLACALVASKLGIPLVHVEAGLRSGDRTMPEEINRLAVDAVSDLFFVTEASGVENLLVEGKSASVIYEVGNVMVDNLFHQKSILDSRAGACAPGEQGEWVAAFKQSLAKHKGSAYGRYAVLTLHRPANVDDPEVLRSLIGTVNRVAQQIPVAFPVHPRALSALERLGVELDPGVRLLPALSYMNFLDLWKDALIVLTDSGGLQEETTALGIPCLTLRENTERPLTISAGTNQLVGRDPERILSALASCLERSRPPTFTVPRLWDGHAASRIVGVLETYLASA